VPVALLRLPSPPSSHLREKPPRRRSFSAREAVAVCFTRYVRVLHITYRAESRNNARAARVDSTAVGMTRSRVCCLSEQWAGDVAVGPACPCPRVASSCCVRQGLRWRAGCRSAGSRTLPVVASSPAARKGPPWTSQSIAVQARPPRADPQPSCAGPGLRLSACAGSCHSPERSLISAGRAASFPTHHTNRRLRRAIGRSSTHLIPPGGSNSTMDGPGSSTLPGTMAQPGQPKDSLPAWPVDERQRSPWQGAPYLNSDLHMVFSALPDPQSTSTYIRCSPRVPVQKNGLGNGLESRHPFQLLVLIRLSCSIKISLLSIAASLRVWLRVPVDTPRKKIRRTHRSRKLPGRKDDSTNWNTQAVLHLSVQAPGMPCPRFHASITNAYSCHLLGHNMDDDRHQHRFRCGSDFCAIRQAKEAPAGGRHDVPRTRLLPSHGSSLSLGSTAVIQGD
jgi:hypothetical protein